MRRRRNADDDELKETIVNELHTPARRRFRRRKVIMRGIDESWQADLIDVQAYSYFNSGYNWMLTVIDNVFKYAWVRPLKRKTKIELINIIIQCTEVFK